MDILINDADTYMQGNKQSRVMQRFQSKKETQINRQKMETGQISRKGNSIVVIGDNTVNNK